MSAAPRFGGTRIEVMDDVTIQDRAASARPLAPQEVGEGLSVISIAKSYDKRVVLSDVSLTVGKGEVVGLLDWRDDFIDALHVSPQHQRLGIGAALLHHAETAIARAGHARIRLETDTFNQQARAFYGKQGYAEVDFYPDEEWHSGFTTVLMSKGL